MSMAAGIAYLERYYYGSIEPSPLALFGSMNMPPNVDRISIMSTTRRSTAR